MALSHDPVCDYAAAADDNLDHLLKGFQASDDQRNHLIKRDPTIASRLSLLESTPAEYGYRNLNFEIVSFKDVFRTDPLPAAYHMSTTRVVAPAATLAPISNIPQVKPAVSPVTFTSVAHPAPASSWATIGGPPNPAQQINIAPSLKNGAVRKAVLLNINDQRLDPKIGRPDAIAWARLNNRIKEQKVCNNYHLLGKCSNGNSCGYAHGDRLDVKEQLALRQKARERVCPFGSDCREIDCFFGHQCPRESACIWDICYFEDLHGLDPTPRMKMYENGEVDILS